MTTSDSRLEKVLKLPSPKEGVVLGGQAQQEINRHMEVITGKFPALFTGLGLTKAEPEHIEVEEAEEEANCTVDLLDQSGQEDGFAIQ